MNLILLSKQLIHSLHLLAHWFIEGDGAQKASPIESMARALWDVKIDHSNTS